MLGWFAREVLAHERKGDVPQRVLFEVGMLARMRDSLRIGCSLRGGVVRSVPLSMDRLTRCPQDVGRSKAQR